MRPVLLIAWREYKQYVFSRGFLLFLVMFPAGIIFMAFATGFLENSRPARTYVVFDQTGDFADAVEEEIEWRRRREAVAAWDAHVAMIAEPTAAEVLPEPFAPAPATRARVRAFEEAGIEAAEAALAEIAGDNDTPFVPPRRRFVRLELPEEAARADSVADAAEALRPYLLDRIRLAGADEPLFAAILVPEGFSAERGAPPAEFWSRNLTDPALENAVSSALASVLQRKAVAALGLAPEELEAISGLQAPVAAFRPDREVEQAELGARDRIETALPAGMTYMLLIVIFGVGNLLLTNTIEERSNKIVEILLSSVTAGQLMMGKLIGIGAVGLTMPTIFFLGGLAAALGVGGGEWAGYAVSALFGSHLVFVYLFYFLCAYVIFAMIFLAIGAMSNSLQDAQSFMGPVMLLVFLPLPFMFMVYQNPNGAIASILTWIPIYTPYAVMMRAAADPPLWEIAGATALMLAFAIVLIRAMGRIFRNAILQAQPARTRDVLKLVRKSEG